MARRNFDKRIAVKTQFSYARVGGEDAPSDNNFELKSADSPASVAYVLYQDAGHTQIWGGVADKIRSRIATGMKENIPIHGAIISTTNVQATKYEDWVRVNVIY